jgi:hypothetical protein
MGDISGSKRVAIDEDNVMYREKSAALSPQAIRFPASNR